MDGFCGTVYCDQFDFLKFSVGYDDAQAPSMSYISRIMSRHYKKVIT